MKYQIKTSWSGYSRGYAYYHVEADSEEEAKELYYENEPVTKVTVRSDIEDEIESVKEVK